jgi:hypothetical protein
MTLFLSKVTFLSTWGKDVSIWILTEDSSTINPTLANLSFPKVYGSTWPILYYTLSVCVYIYTHTDIYCIYIYIYSILAYTVLNMKWIKNEGLAYLCPSKRTRIQKTVPSILKVHLPVAKLPTQCRSELLKFNLSIRVSDAADRGSSPSAMLHCSLW